MATSNPPSSDLTKDWLDEVLEKCMAVDLRSATKGEESTFYIKRLKQAITKKLIQELKALPKDDNGGPVNRWTHKYIKDRVAELKKGKI